MRLEIGNFYVKDIKFGDKLSFDDGVLTINKEKALDFIREDERITEADLYIAKPGDKIRMCPVKEAIEPRVDWMEEDFSLDIQVNLQRQEMEFYMH